MTFNKFKSEWYDQVVPELEKWETLGSSLMDTLRVWWFNEYERIMLSKYDENINCFSDDSIVPKTLEHLEKVWKNYPN